ncbi:MAG: hypothetical protein ISN29_06040 [Gammaproteobacteria bacterium AqS3]|nr:hypothetical protein [Gammaproteobacteria bacterium AqS3]
MLWADGGTRFSGSVTTGPQGFVEVSGKRQLIYAPEAHVNAPTLLLDPTTIVLSDEVSVSNGFDHPVNGRSVDSLSDHWSYASDANETSWSVLNFHGNNAGANEDFIMTINPEAFLKNLNTNSNSDSKTWAVYNTQFKLILQADVIKVTGTVQYSVEYASPGDGDSNRTVGSFNFLTLSAKERIEFAPSATLMMNPDSSQQALWTISLKSDKSIVFGKDSMIRTSLIPTVTFENLKDAAGNYTTFVESGNTRTSGVLYRSRHNLNNDLVMPTGLVYMSAAKTISMDQATIESGRIVIEVGDDTEGEFTMHGGTLLARGEVIPGDFLSLGLSARDNNANHYNYNSLLFEKTPDDDMNAPTFTVGAPMLMISAYSMVLAPNATAPSPILRADAFKHVIVDGAPPGSARRGNSAAYWEAPYVYSAGTVVLRAVDGIDFADRNVEISAHAVDISVLRTLIMPHPEVIEDVHQLTIQGGIISRGAFSNGDAFPFTYTATAFQNNHSVSLTTYTERQVPGDTNSDLLTLTSYGLPSLTFGVLTITGWNLGAVLPHGGFISADTDDRLTHDWWQSVDLSYSVGSDDKTTHADGGTLSVWDRSNALVLKPIPGGAQSRHYSMNILNITGGVNVSQSNFYTTMTNFLTLKTVTFGGGDPSVVRVSGTMATVQPTVSLVNFTVDALYIDMSSGLLRGTESISFKTLGISTGGSHKGDDDNPRANGGIYITHSGDLTIDAALGEISTTPLLTLKTAGMLTVVPPQAGVSLPGSGPGSAKAHEVLIYNDGEITVSSNWRTYTTMVNGAAVLSSVRGGLRAGTLQLLNPDNITVLPGVTLSADYLRLLPSGGQSSLGIGEAQATNPESVSIVAGDLVVGVDSAGTTYAPRVILLGGHVDLSMARTGGSALLLAHDQITVGEGMTLSGAGGVTLSVLTSDEDDGFKMTDAGGSTISLDGGLKIQVATRINISTGAGESMVVSAGTLEMSAPGVAGGALSAINLDGVHLAAGDMTLSAGTYGLDIRRLTVGGDGAILLSDPSDTSLKISHLHMGAGGHISLSMNPDGNAHQVLLTGDSPVKLSFVELGALQGRGVDITAGGGNVESTLGGDISGTLNFVVSHAEGGGLSLDELSVAGDAFLSLKGSGGDAAASAGVVVGSAAFTTFTLTDAVKRLSLSWHGDASGPTDSMYLASGLSALGGLTIIRKGHIVGLSTDAGGDTQGINASAVRLLAGGNLSLDGQVSVSEDATVDLGAGLSLASGGSPAEVVIGEGLHAGILHLTGNANVTIAAATISAGLTGVANNLTLSQKDDLPLTLSNMNVSGTAVIRATQLFQPAAAAAKFTTLTFIAQIDDNDHGVSVDVLNLQNADNTLSRLVLRTVTAGSALRSGFDMSHFVNVVAASNVTLELSDHYIGGGDISLSAGGEAVISAVGMGQASTLDVRRLVARGSAAISTGGSLTLHRSDIRNGGLTISAGGDVSLHGNLTLSSASGAVNMIVTAGGDLSIQGLRVGGDLTAIVTGLATQREDGNRGVMFRTATVSASSVYMYRLDGLGGHISVSESFDIRGLALPAARGAGSWTFQGKVGSLRGVESNATITTTMTTLLQLDLGSGLRSVTVVLTGSAQTLSTGRHEPRQNELFQHRGKYLSFADLTAATVVVKPFNGTLEGGRLRTPSTQVKGTLDVSVSGYVNLSAAGNWVLLSPAATSLTFVGDRAAGGVTVTGNVRVGRAVRGEILLSAKIVRVDSRILAGTIRIGGGTVTAGILSSTLDDLTVVGSSTLTLSDRLGAVSDMYIQGGDSLSSSLSIDVGGVSAGGSVTLSSDGSVILGTPRGSSMTVGGDLTIRAGGDILQDISGGSPGGSLLGSTMTAGGEIFISARVGRISLGLLSTSRGGVTVLAGGGTAILEGVHALKAVTVTAGETVDLIEGEVRTSADVTLSAGDTVQVAGSITTGLGGNVSVLAGTLVQVNGNIEAGGDATLSADETVRVAQAGGVTVSSGDLDVLAGVLFTAGSLSVTGGQVTVEGNLSAGRRIRVLGSLMTIQGVSAGLGATVRGTVVSAGGVTANREDVSVTATNVLQVGVLSAGRHVRARATNALSVSFGAVDWGIRAGEDITLSSERSSITIEGPVVAKMLAGGTVVLRAAGAISWNVEGAQAVRGLGTSLDAGGAVTVSAGGQIHLGRLLGGVGVTVLGASVTLDGVSAHSGVTLSSGTDVSAVSAGRIVAGGDVTVLAGSDGGRISLGKVSAAGGATLSAGYVPAGSGDYGIRAEALSAGGTLVTLHNPGGAVGAKTLLAPLGLVSVAALTFSAALLRAGALTLPLGTASGVFTVGGGSIDGAVSLAGSRGVLGHSGVLSLRGVTVGTLTLHSHEEGLAMQGFSGVGAGRLAVTVDTLHYAGGSLDLGALGPSGVAVNTLSMVRATVSTGGVHILNGVGLTLYSDGPMEGGAVTVSVDGDLAFHAPGAALNSRGVVSVEALIASGNITIGDFDVTRTVTYDYSGTLTSVVRMGQLSGRLMGRLTTSLELRPGDLTQTTVVAAIGGVIHAKGGSITAEAVEGFSMGTVIAPGQVALRTGRTVTYAFDEGAYVEERDGVQVIRRTGVLQVYGPLGVSHILDGETVQVGGRPLTLVKVRDANAGDEVRGGILAGTLRADMAVLDARHWGVTVGALSLSQSLDLDADRARLHGTISGLFGEYAQHYVTLPGTDYNGPYQLNGVHVFGHRQMGLDRSDLAGWGAARLRFEELYFGEGMRFSEYGGGAVRHTAKTGRDFILRVVDDRALMRVHKVWVDPYLRRVLNLRSDELFLLSTGGGEHAQELIRSLEEREEEGFSP